jgi:hypothetical protein
MLLSILGLSVISLGGLIAVQFYRGKVSLRDLHSIMRVIGGTERIMIPNDAYDRYTEFAKDEEAARAELELNRGLPETRVPAAMRARETQQAQQDNLEVQNRLLEEQKRLVEQLRGEVDANKRQVETLIRALDNEREKSAIVEKDATTANLRKMLSEMDAGVIADYLTEIIRDPSQGGPTEAARVMRDHLKADFTAEVLGTLPAAERQRVLPLMENRFAGVPPEAVVQIFNDQKMSAGEMLVHMMQMNPNQALGVYLRLPPNIQEQMSPQLLRN